MTPPHIFVTPKPRTHNLKIFKNETEISMTNVDTYK